MRVNLIGKIREDRRINRAMGHSGKIKAPEAGAFRWFIHSENFF